MLILEFVCLFVTGSVAAEVLTSFDPFACIDSLCISVFLMFSLPAGGTKTINRNRKSKQTEKPKKTKPKCSTNDPLSSSEDDNDGDECCSAERCLRPKCKKVTLKYSH